MSKQVRWLIFVFIFIGGLLLGFIGSIIIPRIEQVVLNEKLRCEPPAREPGGGGVNVSRAIRRLGGDSLAIYPCGGLTGELFKELLDDEGVEHQPVTIEGMTRENSIIFETGSNQQYIFDMPGPELGEEEWQRALEALSDIDPAPDYVVASGSIPPGVPDDFYQRVAELAHEIGSRLIVDTSEEPLRLATEAGVYLIKPNMRELGQLAGREIESEEHQIAAAKDLVETKRTEVVVVSMGAGGALLVTDETEEHLRTPTVPIKSRIGAGDSMVAGIVLGLSRGKGIRAATLFGMAAGTATVMLPGTEFCRREDTEALYQRLASGEVEM